MSGEEQQPSSGAGMRLKVKTLPNGEHNLEVPANTRVEELKARLVELTGIPAERQRIIYRGRALNDGESLQSHGVEDGHTLHLVERSTNAPPPGQTQNQQGDQPQIQPGNEARISVNVGGPGGAGLQDIGRMVQGVLRAVGMEGGIPLQVQMGGRVVQGESGQPNAATGPGARHQAGGGQGPGGGQNSAPVENVPHLLSTVAQYINRLDSGQLPTRTLPVISLTPPAPEPGQDQPPQFAQEIQALTSSICQILQNENLEEGLRSQLENARASIDAPPGEGDTGDSRNVRFNLRFGSGGEPAPVQSYSHLPLLVATLGRLVSRADRLFRERASRSLANACQQLLSATEVDESNQELLEGGVRQIASVLNWYGALFVELARVAACAVPAMQGNIIPLAANTAAVIGAEGTYPNFRLFFPRGIHDNQESGGMQGMPHGPGGAASGAPQRMNLGEDMVPHVGIVTVSGQEQAIPGSHEPTPVADRVDVTLIEPSGQMFTASAGNQPGMGGEQTTQPTGDLGSVLGPLVQQLASGVMGNLQQHQSETPGDGPNSGNARAGVLQALTAAMNMRNNRQGSQGQGQAPAQVANTNRGPNQPVSAPLTTSQAPVSGENIPSSTPSAGNSPSSGTLPTPPISTNSPATGVSASPSGARRPAGLGLGSGLRRAGPRLPRGPAPAANVNQGNAGPAPIPTRTPPSQPSAVPSAQPNSTSGGPNGGGPDLMSMLGGVLQGGGGAGGGLAQMMESMASNPALQRMADDPQIRGMVDSVVGDGSQPQDLGSLMNRMLPQMMPMMGQLLGGSQGTGGRGQPQPPSDSILDQQLPPDEAARWKEILEKDATQQMSNPPGQTLSEVYLAGESAGKSGGILGLVDSVAQGAGKDDEDKDGSSSMHTS